ncbi:hypothetical protein M426DRAFT_122458 [Hypoxylon sp. CI-4A]|nr:hypothetical protein M426DRAFT_122458 [Hypoxylon sp. CI-4A]
MAHQLLLSFCSIGIPAIAKYDTWKTNSVVANDAVQERYSAGKNTTVASTRQSDEMQYGSSIRQYISRLSRHSNVAYR